MHAWQLLAAGHFSFNAFDIEVDATQELVVSHFVFFQQRFTCVVDERTFPNGKATVFQTCFDLIDLGFGVGRHVFSDRNDIDRAFFDTPPHTGTTHPFAFQGFTCGFDVVRSPVDDAGSQVGLGTVCGHV